MKPFIQKFSSTKVAAVVMVACISGAVAPAFAGLPVIDGSNLTQNVVTAIETVAQTTKQIQQYKTQLQQYENMLQNTAKPSQQTWDAAMVTMNQLRSSIDTLSYYKNNLGSVDAYLQRFQDTNTYRNSPCYSVKGCTPAQWRQMQDSEKFGSEAQKRANDAFFRGLDQQQNALERDARQLQRLQSSANDADGQMQAIGYANQFASHQANQLLQLRALLIAQQNAIATRNQVLADREAREAAAAEKFHAGEFRKSAVFAW